MEQRRFIIIVIIFILVLVLLANIVKVYGINFELSIIGENKIGINQQIQFHASYDMINDMPEPGKSAGGIVGSEDYTNKVKWKSSNKKVAVVDNNGIVIGISTGKATISAELNGEKAATLEIEVVKDIQTEPNTPIVRNNEISEEPNNSNTTTEIVTTNNTEIDNDFENESEVFIEPQVITNMEDETDMNNLYSEPYFYINPYTIIIIVLLGIIATLAIILYSKRNNNEK